MKKLIFAIFAHPDDEAFGPSGTLLLETRAGSQLHLITLTNGGNGMNPDKHPDLGKVRLEEWRRGGELMGATSMHHLGYSDGGLSNNDMITASQQVINLVRSTIDGHSKPYEVEFMTSDLNGISGHIDHIVAARTACFAFYKLREAGVPTTRIRLACIPHEYLPAVNTDWLFMEPGHRREEIDEVVDARLVRNEIIEIMRAHHTQRADGERHILQRGALVGMNYFLVKD